MKITNKTLISFLAIGIMASFSCNSNTSKKEESSTVTVDTTATTTSKLASEFKPFNVALLTNTVKDYAKMRTVFDADSNNRKANGMETIVVGREIDKPNNILIGFAISDVQKTKGFFKSPKLKEAMQKAGVISKSDVLFLDVIRFNKDSKEKQWVDVTHKVKDFNAWLKVFDAEGSAKRASDGLVDVVLARGVDDSNLVHLVFDITDMAKAKASMISAEKKKLMMSAGVQGTPKIEFYKEAE